MKRCLLFSLSLASCQAPEKAADVDRDAVAAEIKTEADKYLKFLFARDLEQWTALFKRDGFEMIINGNAGLVFYTGRQLRPVSEIHGEDLHKQSIWSIHLELPFIKLAATSRSFTRTLSSRSSPSTWRRD